MLQIGNFNTSHVTVYHQLICFCVPAHRHFNTSHVTVYPVNPFVFDQGTNHFNTSHVTVYPQPDSQNQTYSKFQYIPCYGLSGCCAMGDARGTQFQYIPCYGLSLMQGDKSKNEKNFNTSHVTVYQVIKGIDYHYIKISIHPMLRFIGSGCWNLCIGLYISIHPMLRFIARRGHCPIYVLNFNTSHVTVYQR